MSYYILRQEFPYAIDVPEREVQGIARVLAEGRPAAPDGSSFAVTSDTSAGLRRVWLSLASYRTLERLEYDGVFATTLGEQAQS